MRNSAVSSLHSERSRAHARTQSVGARPPIALPVVASILAAVDGVAVFWCGFTALKYVPVWDGAGRLAFPMVAFLGTVLAHDVLRIAGGYRSATMTARDVGIRLVAASGIVTLGIVITVAWVAGPDLDGIVRCLILWLCLGLTALVADRLVVMALRRQWQRTGRLCRRVAVVGVGLLGERVLRQFETGGEAGGVEPVRIAGVYDDRPGIVAQFCGGHRIAGTVDDLLDDIRQGKIDDVVLAIPGADEGRMAKAMRKLGAASTAVWKPVDELSFRAQPCSIGRLGEVQFLGLMDAPLIGWRGIGKGMADRLLAVIALVLLSSVMVVVALLIKLDSPGPVLFRQMRHGLNNRLFEVLKFRTMHQDQCDPAAERLTRRNDPRVTRLGVLLRRTMLDELPQLINVLRGEMSIVGPRPHALRAKAGGMLYRDAVPNYDARHRVRPGMTGWAQVNGWRGTTDTIVQLEKRVECDLFYVENWSPRLDLVIILRTLLLPFGASRDALPMADAGRSRPAA